MASPFKKKKSQFYWVRIAVPEDLKAKISSGEIQKSLLTTDPSQAAILAAEFSIKWKREFKRLREEIASEELAQAPELVDRFLRSMDDATYGDVDRAIYAIQKALTVELLTAWGPEEFQARRADLALAYMPPDEEWANWADAEIADVIPEAERDTLINRIRLLHHNALTFGAGFREAIQYIKSGRRWDVMKLHVFMVGETTKTNIERGSALYDAVAEALLDRLIAHQSHRWDPDLLAACAPPASSQVTNSRLDSGLEAAGAAPAQTQQQSSASSAAWSNAGARSDSTQTLSSGLKRWIKSRSPSDSAITEATRAVDRFIDLYGDRHVASISVNDIFDYRDFITDMPRGLSLPEIKQSGKSLAQVVADRHAEERAEHDRAEASGRIPPELKRLSPTSIKKDIGGLSAIFTTLKSERWVLQNPAEKIPVDGYTKGRKVYPFRPEMMRKLFDSPLFTGCQGARGKKRAQVGPYVFQDVIYWSFLFGATAGHRMSEMGAALTANVEEAEGPNGEKIVGIFIMDAKNEHSQRVIIVHPRLVDLGFLEHVRERRRLGKTHLFDLPGGGRRKLSERLNDYIDQVLIDDRQFVFHSMRHEFADRSEISIDVETSKKIMGHARGRLYGLGAPLHHAAAELNKVDMSFIDWARLNAAAGRFPQQSEAAEVVRASPAQGALFDEHGRA